MEQQEKNEPDLEETGRDDHEIMEAEAGDDTEAEQPEEVNSVIEPASIPMASVGANKSRKLGKRQILLVVAIVFAALFLAWWYLVREETVTAPDATSLTQVEQAPKLGVAVGLVEGSVEYSKDGANWTILTAATDVVQGDSVRVADGGRAVLLIDDGSALRLAGGSAVKLVDLSTTDVRIENLYGEVYSRVVASESRKFNVVVGDSTFLAKGTAYRTFNTESKKGVEVYHSVVASGDKDVSEGNALFTLNSQKEKENVITAIDLEALKNDDFMKWNCDEDKKIAEFADKLGVLSEFDKPAPVAPKPVAPTAASGITLSGAVSEYSAKFSWKVKDVDTSQGFKLVKSKTSKTPTYPENSAAYIEAGKTSYSLFLGDGKTYFFRICAYRGDTCVSYSNTVTITTPVKEVEKVVSGPVTLSLTGNIASWTYGGTAPHGFKLVISKSPDTPSYGDADKTFYTGTPHTIEGLDSGSYNIRVCKYTASSESGGCTDYSNQVSLVVP